MKNQKGISLIALIITIIVIIILAAIVISSAVRTPESANWAKFCGNYAEIQSAISTVTAETYGKAMLTTSVTTKPSMDEVREWVVSTANSTSMPATFPAATGTGININADNHLGIKGLKFGTDWAVDKDGVLYHRNGVPNPNDGGALYKSPTATK
jgi:type II secretory pathway pseudopilin PulG